MITLCKIACVVQLFVGLLGIGGGGWAAGQVAATATVGIVACEIWDLLAGSRPAIEIEWGRPRKPAGPPPLRRD